MQWYHEFRELFPITRNQIYMDVASHNSLPITVVEAMQSFLHGLCHTNNESETPMTDRISKTRTKMASLINCVPDEIAFVKNTQEGINIVAQGIPWKRGDNIIINDEDHSSNVIPWLNLKNRGVEIRVAQSEYFRVPLESIEQHVDENTRAIAISFVQHRSGYRADLTALGNLCSKMGIWLIVDGIQGLGSLEIDVQSAGVHALSAGAYKHLLGPAGTGVLYCSRHLLREMVPVYAGPSRALRIDKDDGWNLQVIDQQSAARLEGGNLPHCCIVGLDAALDILHKYGMDRIESRILALTQQLIAGLQHIGYEVISSTRSGERSGLVCVRIPDAAHFDAYLQSYRIKGSIKSPTIVRLSLHAYNLEWEVERTLEVLSAYDKRR